MKRAKKTRIFSSIKSKCLFEVLRGIGKIIIISTSKIKKITVIMKNRSEKAVRVLWSGSKPHSKADAFSRAF
jgi:hypothetical protein